MFAVARRHCTKHFIRKPNFCSAFSTHALNDTQWWTIKEEERLPITQSNAVPIDIEVDEDVFVSHHPSIKFSNTLSTIRSQYPNNVWNTITRLFPDRKEQHTKCVDIAIASEGRAGIELNKRGFDVIGVEADATLLARTFQFAQSHNAPNIELVTAKVEHSLLHDNCADLVTFFHGLHLVDTSKALQEAYRLLKPGGYLAVTFNDRNLSDEFIRDLEDIMEHHITTYNRWQKQRGVEEWSETLEDGKMFKLLEYSVFKNPIHMPRASALIDVLDCFSFVRSSLRGEARKRFNNDVRALLERRFGRKSFDLPLETKMYVLTSLKSREEVDDGDYDGDSNILEGVMKSGSGGGHHKHHTHHGKAIPTTTDDDDDDDDDDDRVKREELNCWSGGLHRSSSSGTITSVDDGDDADHHRKHSGSKGGHHHHHGGHNTIFSQ